MSITVSKPLKLEDQCLLHLICHLEDYLPETLALLPLHLRRRLLLNLPAADVCQLENTAVSSGIDIEGSIWKVLGERYARRYASELRDPDNPEHLKMYVFTLMWRYKGFDLQRAKNILFSVEDCLGVTNWEGILHEFAPVGTGNCSYPTPHRYARYSSVECKEIELISLLVTKCQWMPTQLRISSWDFRTSQLWKEYNKYRNITRRFLSRVQEVSLTDSMENIFPFILKEILSNRQTALHRLRFQIAQYGENTLAVVAPLFSQASRRVDPHHSHPNIPYNKLSSIAVKVCVYRTCGRSVPQLSMDHELKSMLLFQKALSSVDLHHYNPSVSMMSALGSLFHQPQFRELNIYHTSITQSELNALLPPFLSAPSGEHEQALNLVNVVFRGIKAPREDVGSDPTHEGTSLSTQEDSSADDSSCSVLRLPCKALTMRWPSRSPDGAFQCLSAYNCTGLLSSLTVDGFKKYWYRNVKFTLHCPRTTMLQHLRLRALSLTLQPSPDQLFSNLFQGPHLKTLHLINCSMGKVGLLPALTQGLRRQITVGSLEDLSLETNYLGTSPDPELQEFFDVLFSLPQLSNLKVNLKFNCLKPSHFSIMHKSWKKKCGQSGRVLKVLEIRDQYPRRPRFGVRT